MKICKIKYCGKKHNAKGYCIKHYSRWRRWGNAFYVRKHTDEIYRYNASQAKIGLKAGSKHHNWKGGKKYDAYGYVLIYSPKHPRCDKNRYVSEHRLVMEKHLGRYLTQEEVIHHINGIKDDNRIKNLMLFENFNKHFSYHKEIKKGAKQ